MIKKILLAAVILSIASCHSKVKEDKLKIEDNANDDKAGNYQTLTSEQQAAILDQQAQAKALEEQAKINKTEEVEVQDRVFFGYDSAELSDDAKKILDTQAEWLKSDPAINVTIEGHCDERGTREYNIALGEKRANAAKKSLVSHGIDASRIKTISYGKERPAFFGNNEESMSKNRRAVTVVN